MRRDIRARELLRTCQIILQCVLTCAVAASASSAAAEHALPGNLEAIGDWPSVEDQQATRAVQSTEDTNPAEDEKTTKNAKTTMDVRADEGPAKGENEASAQNEKETENKKDSKPVGDPLAPGIVTLLEDEVRSGFKRRGIEPNFARFERYAGRKLDNTAGDRRTSEVTGNCRLKWYDHLLRNPLKAPVEAEQFTRMLHAAVLDDHEGLDRALVIAGGKLDLGGPPARSFDPVGSPEAAMEVVRRVLTEVQMAYSAALSPLSGAEINKLAKSLYPVLTSNCRVGHTLTERSTGRYLCDLMEKKIDRNAMHQAARALVPLSDPKLLEQLRGLSEEGETTVKGTTGKLIRRITTASGDIIVGGKGNNTYQLDVLSGLNVLIDLGGDDVYYEGTCSIHRPVLILIDLGGDDAYRAGRPGVQGSAVLGVSMLLDLAGDDVYEAKDIAQGSCLAGVGILIDYAGNDSYRALRRAQGQAIGGVGILIDHGGNDKYHAAMWAQGFGGPLGFGMLDDLSGKDHYYGGGLYPDSYDETPGYEGWSQGMGAGIRQVADGGIGVILDGDGDDTYEFDYLSHGGGYWLGLGFARDFAGDDQRLGATRKAYNGGQRTQRRFQRFGNGFGCHYALGFLFDDRGDDTYSGTIMGVGFAWDVAVGVLCDFAGNDRYEATGGGTQGNGAQAGLGIIYDYDGNDVYRGYGQGRASSSISYHDLPTCGGNFSFVIDYGGTDKYGCGAGNNSYNRRSSAGGFLIDRPKLHEIDSPKTARKPATGTTAGP